MKAKLLTVTTKAGKKPVMIYPGKFDNEAQNVLDFQTKHASEDQTWELNEVDVYEKQVAKRQGKQIATEKGKGFKDAK